jgi:hypothetical protein
MILEGGMHIRVGALLCLVFLREFPFRFLAKGMRWD